MILCRCEDREHGYHIGYHICANKAEKRCEVCGLDMCWWCWKAREVGSAVLLPEGRWAYACSVLCQHALQVVAQERGRTL